MCYYIGALMLVEDGTFRLECNVHPNGYAGSENCYTDYFEAVAAFEREWRGELNRQFRNADRQATVLFEQAESDRLTYLMHAVKWVGGTSDAVQFWNRREPNCPVYINDLPF